MKYKKDKIQEIENTPQSNGEELIKVKKHSAISIITKSVIAIIVFVFLFAFGFTFQVREGNYAVVMRMGKVVNEITDAGLYFKLPWPFDNVVTYDGRLQYLESKKLETVTEDPKNVILQSYVVWQISDPKLYHERVGVNNSINGYINDQIYSATNQTLGKYKMLDLVSSSAEHPIKLDEIQGKIFQIVHDVCKDNYGIEVKDLSILRLSLPDTNLDDVFKNMWSKREQEIEKILGDARAKANEIITGANADAAKKEGEGTEKAAEIKAKAEEEVLKLYKQAKDANMELFTFLTNLNTMVNSMNSSTVLVVKGDEYPFNILTEYSKVMAPSDNEVAIADLELILGNPNLPEKDRQALIDALGKILENEKNKVSGGGTTTDNGTTDKGTTEKGTTENGTTPDSGTSNNQSATLVSGAVTSDKKGDN